MCGEVAQNYTSGIRWNNYQWLGDLSRWQHLYCPAVLLLETAISCERVVFIWVSLAPISALAMVCLRVQEKPISYDVHVLRAWRILLARKLLWLRLWFVMLSWWQRTKPRGKVVSFRKYVDTITYDAGWFSNIVVSYLPFVLCFVFFPTCGAALVVVAVKTPDRAVDLHHCIDISCCIMLYLYTNLYYVGCVNTSQLRYVLIWKAYDTPVTKIVQFRVVDHAYQILKKTSFWQKAFIITTRINNNQY